MGGLPERARSSRAAHLHSARVAPTHRLTAVSPPDKREGWWRLHRAKCWAPSLPLVGRGDQAQLGGWEPHARTADPPSVSSPRKRGCKLHPAPRRVGYPRARECHPGWSEIARIPRHLSSVSRPLIKVLSARPILPPISPATDGTGHTDGAGGPVGAGLRLASRGLGLTPGCNSAGPDPHSEILPPARHVCLISNTSGRTRLAGSV